jgi:hypothetical protein
LFKQLASTGAFIKSVTVEGDGTAAGDCQVLQMLDAKAASPTIVEIFADEGAVAAVRFVLGAEQAGALQRLRLHVLLDLALRHQVEKVPRKGLPVALVGLVGLHDRLGGRKKRLVHIVDTADLLQEERKVIGLGEAGKLRGIVQPDIDDRLDAGLLQAIEKIFRR